MPKYETYQDIESIPDSVDCVVSPGRQLSLGWDLESALAQPYGLSPMSHLNVLAGAMVAEATEGTLVVTGNKNAGFPQGAGVLLAERYPDVPSILEFTSPTTLASARHVAPLLGTVIRESGLVEVVITSDGPQGKRLASMLADHGVAVRGIAIAHKIVAHSVLPSDQALVDSYERDRWNRRMEDAKQTGLRKADPRGTRVENLARRFRP